MKNYWLSWYHCETLGEFELHFPWWVSGETLDEPPQFTICAAVQAESEAKAVALINECYDKHPGFLKWRFINEREDDWSPFGDRFQKADWMKWTPLGESNA